MSAVAFLLFSGRKFGGMERRYVRLFGYLCRNGTNAFLLTTHDAVEGARDLGIEIPLERVRFIDLDLRDPTGWTRKLNRVYGLINALLMAAVGGYQQVHIVANPGFLVNLYARMSRVLPRYSFSVVDSRLGFSPDLIDRVVRSAYAVDCLSEGIARYVQAHCRRAADLEKIHVAPCSFIDLSSIDEEPRVRDIDLVMMARFSPEKGYSLFLEALPKIPSNLIVHLCGFGEHPPQTSRAEIYESNNPIEVLSRSKIFLSLQEAENYPSQSLLEAMACRCAIIATDVGETRRLLDETCSLLIPSSPDRLVEAIMSLVNDSDRCLRLGLSAKRRIFKEHTLERFADYFSEMILVGIGVERDKRIQAGG